MTSQLQQRIVARLADGKKTLKELHAELPEADNEKQVANALYQLRQKKTVVREEDSTYRLTGKAGRGTHRAHRAARAPAPSPAGRATSPAPRAAATATADNAETLRAILARSVTQTQNALDDYLASLADPHVLTPLRAARDAAQAAVRAFDAKMKEG